MSSFHACNRWLAGLAFLFLPLLALAAEVQVVDPGSAAVAALQKAFPAIKVSNAQSAPVPGFVEVEVNGSAGDRAYITNDGKFLFVGNLFRLDNGVAIDLTRQRLEKSRSGELAKVKPVDMITFAATGKQKAEVYVFTDITCPFCERFHTGIKDINARGITVHYLAFPRAGLGDQVARDMSRIWCAADARSALTQGKQGKPVDKLPQRPGCLSPVANQYDLGVRLGVHGTPSVMTADGKELGGYLTPGQLAKELGI